MTIVLEIGAALSLIIMGGAYIASLAKPKRARVRVRSDVRRAR